MGLLTLKAQIDAYAYIFVVAAVILLVGAVLAFWIKVPNERSDVHVMVE